MFGIHHHGRSAVGLVGPHRRIELALGRVLDALIDGEVDVVPGERLLVLDALAEEQAARAIAQARAPDRRGP